MISNTREQSNYPGQASPLFKSQLSLISGMVFTSLASLSRYLTGVPGRAVHIIGYTLFALAAACFVYTALHIRKWQGRLTFWQGAVLVILYVVAATLIGVRVVLMYR